MSFWGLIPARMESSRLPGKPLLDICGLPMIIHVAKRSSLSEKLDRVVVCTDNSEIAETCFKYGVSVCLTPFSCQNGTERIAYAARVLGLGVQDHIIDIQGDEPLVQPRYIDEVISAVEEQGAYFDILLPYLSACEQNNPNTVKVVTSGSRVVFLTRSDSPYPFVQASPLKKHLSIIGFTYSSLQDFCDLPIGELEKVEGIELLRALEAGKKIMGFPVTGDSFSVDTQEDYTRAVRAMSKCPLYQDGYEKYRP